MNSQDRFQTLMRELRRVMRIDLADDVNEVYSIMFSNQVEVHLLNTQEGKIDVICEAGTLVNRNASQALLDLIALNRPPLAVSIDKDSGSVMVWARQALDEIDIERLTELITELVKTVYIARNCLDCRSAQDLFGPGPGEEALRMPPKGEGTLAQLRRRN